MTSLEHTIIKHRGLIIFTVMMVAILEVLDSTIVNVALPSMMPALGANQNQITWVLTAYVVASAIMVPLTGFLSTRFGNRSLLLFNITGFLAGSMLSGLSQDLTQIIFFRIIQGACGAALIPISQSILRTSFPISQQGKAMTIWGLGIMMAPIMGPTIGGYITEGLSWRWVFYLNLPFCLLAILLTLYAIPKDKGQKNSIDYVSLISLVIGIGALQIMLDQGNEKGWFSSNFIVLLAVLSFIGLATLIFRSFTLKKPLILLKLYFNRNFAICNLIMLCFAGCLFGIIAVEPMMLERLYDYPIITTGLMLAPLGLGSAIGMIGASILMKKMDVRVILFIGLLGSSTGCFWLSSIAPATPTSYFLWPNFILGISMGLIMIPISTYSLLTIPKPTITEGAGLLAFSRMIGTSIGISIISTMLSHGNQVSWHTMGQHINRFSTTLQSWLTHQDLQINSPVAIGRLQQILASQSSIQSFLNVYYALGFAFAILMFTVLFIEPVDLTDADLTAAH
jgi:DHA2 family multidrug resistance protein